MYKDIKDYINLTLRPMARADGGDMICTHIDEDTLIIDAYGDCATCNSCGEDMKWWLNKKLKSKFNKTYTIKIKKNVPYFDL